MSSIFNKMRIVVFTCCLLPIIMAFSICPLSVRTIIKTTGNPEPTNTLSLTDKSNVYFHVVHNHLANKRTVLNFRMLIVNGSRDDMEVNKPCLLLKPSGLVYKEVRTDIGYNTKPLYTILTSDTLLKIRPGDTLVYQAVYSGSYHGTFAGFKDSLTKAHIYFDLKNIFLSGKEYAIKDAEILPLIEANK